jgi:hypothetical protein
VSSQKCFFTSLGEVSRFKDPEITRIAIAKADGNNVVVGIDSKAGDTGILFYPDCVLSEKFKTENGLTSSAFKSGRVRVARFKGEWSEALFIRKTQEDINRLFGSGYKLGDFLEPTPEVYSVYVPKVVSVPTQSSQAGGKFKKGYLPNFPMHVDTEQFRSHIGEIEKLFNQGWKLSISAKVHGTSARTHNIRVPKDPNVFESFYIWVRKKLNLPVKNYIRSLEEKYFDTEGDYKIINGTRRVILSNVRKELDDGFYPVSFRDKTSYFGELLEKDVGVYYEILGWESQDKAIMAKGPNGYYDYGIPNGEFAIQVYRITVKGLDLEPEEMENYCLARLNLASVYRMTDILSFEHYHFEEIFKIVSSEFEKSASISCINYIDSGCNPRSTGYNHINEGIVIRLDPPSEKINLGPKFFKLKRPEFYEAEGMIKAAEAAKVSLEQE